LSRKGHCDSKKEGCRHVVPMKLPLFAEIGQYDGQKLDYLGRENWQD
jgi:hypothetical protein